MIQFDKELGTKWIEALRSGEYQQGFGSLKANDCYCALGVLGKVCEIEDKDLLWYNELTDILTDEKLKRFLYTPYALLYNFEQYIIHLNDTKRMSFSEIADWLEQNLIYD